MVSINKLIKKADAGDVDAMLKLGTMYRWGKGVVRDMDKCLYWTKQAAAMLSPAAYKYLGYHYGIPVGYSDINDDTADYKTVFDCFFKGAILDDANSMYKVGDMYFTGKFVEKDQRFAFKLYKESDELYDYPSAGLNLRFGECYCFGIGTEQDIDEAREHLEDAISKYEKRASAGSEAPEFFMEGFNRAKNLLKRIEADKIPGRPILLDDKEMREEYTAFINNEMLDYNEPKYYIKELESLKSENPKIEEPDVFFNDILASAESGDKVAMYDIAFYCFNRFENKPDNNGIIDFSLHYYHKAIRYGNQDAMYNLGSIYYHGDGGVTIDRKKAYYLYLYSNVHIAKGEIGVYYAKGEIVKQDYEKAFKCFVKCALLKINACYGSLANLARMYREGIFVEADEKFAEHLDFLSKKAQENIYSKAGGGV